MDLVGTIWSEDGGHFVNEMVLVYSEAFQRVNKIPTDIFGGTLESFEMVLEG